MAFRQPTLASRNKASIASEQLSIQIAQPSRLTQQQNYANAQEWILFNPSPASTTNRTLATTAARTPTVTCSQISDFGSFETGLWSYDDDDEILEEDENDEFGEDGELDSLDSHLLEFSIHTSLEAEPSRTVLPTHDGLGSFKLNHTETGDDSRDNLSNYDNLNSRRAKRQRAGPEVDISELSGEKALEAERIRRIEMWTLQQSRVLVDEIKRESRREQQSSNGRSHRSKALEPEPSSSADDTRTEAPDSEKETLWKIITRRVIRDLIGIDDNILSIFFGESLPHDLETSTGTAPSTRAPGTQQDQSSWEYKLIERIAHELDILAHHITDHSPSSKSHLYLQNIPLSYAGLPIIAEGKNNSLLPTGSTTLESSFVSQSSGPEFRPTIQTYSPGTLQSTASNFGSVDTSAINTRAGTLTTQELTQEDWERDLNLKVVFKYIRDRMTATLNPSSSNLTTTASTSPNRLGALNTADFASRAARVRQQHPLVSGRRFRQDLQPASRTWKVSVPSGSVGTSIAGGTPTGGVTGKTNLSYSTKKSSRGSGSYAGDRIFHSGSSRHYWDWSGSVGSANAVAGIDAIESWGEV